MKALVYHGPGKRAWEEAPKPALNVETDAIVKITKTTICGTDLHIMKGDVPAVTKGRILGHEGIGVIVEAGKAVSNFRNGDKAIEKVMALTENKGVDAAIEAVGIPATFDICQAIVAAGGHIANVGVHGKSVELHLEKLWAHNITLTTRLVDTVTTPMLLKTVVSGKLQPKQLITHHFKLSEIMKAYDTFGNAAQNRALKVILTNEEITCITGISDYIEACSMA